MKLNNINKIDENEFLDYINEWESKKEKIYPIESDPKDLNFKNFKDKINKDHKSNLFFLTSQNGYIHGSINIKYNNDSKDIYLFSNISFGIRPNERNKNFAFIMIKLALNELRINGITKASIIINRKNKASRNTIQKVSGKLISSKIINKQVLELYEIEL